MAVVVARATVAIKANTNEVPMKLTTPVLALALASLAGCSSKTTMHSGYPAETSAARMTAEPIARSATPSVPHLLPGQPGYSSPEDAVQALYRASVAKDLPGIARIVGLPESDLNRGERLPSESPPLI